MDEIGLLNKKKYLKPPTIEQIDEFRLELEVTDLQFERFYELPRGTLKAVRYGSRPLASTYWHFIYEKIKPAYGSGFIQDYAPRVTDAVTPQKTEETTEIYEKTEQKPTHKRLNRLK